MARRYTREFKVSAVKLVNEQGYSPRAAAKSLGVDPGCVRDWVKKLGSGPAAAPPAWRPAAPGRWRPSCAGSAQENARLRMEREILKKAAAFFAREQP